MTAQPAKLRTIVIIGAKIKTILLELIPAFIAFNNSPIDTTSAPEPIFLSSLNKVKFELDFTEKHIIGLIFLNILLNLKKLFFNCASE